MQFIQFWLKTSAKTDHGCDPQVLLVLLTPLLTLWALKQWFELEQSSKSQCVQELPGLMPAAKKRVSTYQLCATFFRLFSLQIPSFNGKSSHLIFAGLGQKSPLWNDFELVIRPTEDNGLILYNGDRSNPNGDFVAVFLSQGYIEFAFDAGDGATVVR